MPAVFLPALFLVAGLLGIAYFRLIPSSEELRQRLPNRMSWASIVLTILIGVGIWLIVEHTSSPYMRASGITTLLFYLLTFESFLLLTFRWTRSNLLAVIIAAGLTFIPFAIQYKLPSYPMSNALIIAATLGATSLIVRLNLLRTRIIILASILLMINDILNVRYILPKLPLGTPPAIPPPLLIFPTVNIAGRVVGSGDFMFLALANLVILRDIGKTAAIIHVVIQAVALSVALLLLGKDILFPYLTVMTPIFLAVYIIGYRKKRHART